MTEEDNYQDLRLRLEGELDRTMRQLAFLNTARENGPDQEQDNERRLLDLEVQLERTIRECDALKDIKRAAQYLVDAMHLHYEDFPKAEHLVSENYASLKAALRTYYQPNGTGR